MIDAAAAAAAAAVTVVFNVVVITTTSTTASIQVDIEETERLAIWLEGACISHCCSSSV